MAGSVGPEAMSKRPLRADAQRNRDAIVRAARETFEAEGVLASIDGIAMRAGVGNATLYRNFPIRDDLLAAVMENSINELLEEADELVRSLRPREALTHWLVRLTWQLRIWHDLPHCLAVASHDPASPVTEARAPLLTRTGALLSAAKISGDVIETITGDELFELIIALSWAVDRFHDDEPAARRRVQIATSGIFT
ncbi:TetR/AcrR family transcriptional regulator [Streptomyces chartreusis]|uniref:TetR/AcrR family transcriptional regulator n=1 Tax=Streptomyces chartreusis TaxID=1969 RepID=UPI003679B4C3